MSLTVYIRNPGASKLSPVDPAHIKTGNLRLPEQEDKLDPREVDLTFIRDSETNVPCVQGCEVIIARDQDVRFRGYVKSAPKITGKSKSIKAYGAEHDLLARSPPMYFYKHGEVTLVDLFSDDLSDGSPPGILALANSAVPPGLAYTIYDSVKNIAKLAGWGIYSNAGTKAAYGIDYTGVEALTECSALADLQTIDNAVYRDATDLYVRISTSNYNSGWYDLGGLAIDGCFDTTCRQGVVADTSKTIDGNLQLIQEDNLGDYAIDLLAKNGMYCHIRDDWAYTYFDLDDSEGETRLITLDESNLSDPPDIEPGSLERIPGKDWRVHGLTAKGVGNQYYSLVETDWKGHYIAGDLHEVEHGFKDPDGILVTQCGLKYSSLQSDYRWKLTTRRNVAFMPGDIITLRPLYEPSENIMIKSIEEDVKTGAIMLELGKKRPTNKDSRLEISGVPRGYTDRYLMESHEPITTNTTLYPYDPAHGGTIADLSFAVPSGVKDAGLKPVITITSTLSWETSQSLDIGRMAIRFWVGSTYPSTGRIVGTTIGEVSPEIEITSHVTANATNHVYCIAQMYDEATGSHADYNGHPKISITVTMNFYKRGSIA
jgi:hypothetical protein